MTSHRRSRQPGLRFRAASPAGLTPTAPSSSAPAAAVVCRALATLVLVCAFAIPATAVASPGDEPARPTEDQAFPGLARQARAATAKLSTRPSAPRAQPTDPGFDWGSAAAGAAGAAGLIALVSLGAPALNTRRRLRTGR